MITTVASGVSLLMVTYATVYGVVKGFDKMMGKELTIQSMTIQEWSDRR